MNSNKTLQKIMTILGLQPQVFFESKTDQGITVKMEGELELGALIYVATEEGLIPAPAGAHTLMDGTKIEVDEESKITEIEMGDMEDEEEDLEKDEKDKDEEFADVKLKDGMVMRVEGDEPTVGRLTKKVSYDGALLPFTDGTYETTDGKMISIVGGMIEGIKEKGKDEAFSMGETEKGEKMESKTFKVGEEMMSIQGGKKMKAADGEHKIKMKDDEGKEIKMRIMVKNGMITKSEKMKEDDEEDKEAEKMAEVFAKAIKNIETKIDMLVSRHNQLETKVQKFGKEPAGDRVYTQKTITDSPITSDKLEGIKRLRAAMDKN